MPHRSGLVDRADSISRPTARTLSGLLILIAVLGEQNGGEKVTPAIWCRPIGQERSDGCDKIVIQCTFLIVTEPQTCLPVGHHVSRWVGFVVGDVDIELRENRRQTGPESPAMIIIGHRLSCFGVDDGTCRLQTVAALDSPAFTFFAVDLDQPVVDQQSYLAIHRGLRDVGHAVTQLRDRERLAVEGRVDDPQSHRVQQEFGGIHLYQ
jgi:hypothetical protein